MGDASPILDKAYDLIEKGQLKEANSLLNTLLPEHEANADVWWMLAHSAEDVTTGKRALQKVEAIAPDYPGLQELLNQASTVDAKASANRGVLFRVIPLVIILLLAFAIIVFLISNANTGTQVAENPTADPVATTNIVASDATPTLDILPLPTATTDANTALITDVATEVTPTQDTVATDVTTTTVDAQAVETEVATATDTDVNTNNSDFAFLSTFNIPDNGVVVSNGAVDISLCAVVGVEAGNGIKDLVLALAENNAQIDSAITQVSISVIDCFDTGTEQRAVSISRSAIVDYANKSIDLQALQQAITPIR